MDKWEHKTSKKSKFNFRNKFLQKSTAELLKQLKENRQSEIKTMDRIFAQNQQGIDELSLIEQILCKIMCLWVKLELSSQRLNSISLQRFENQKNKFECNQEQKSQLISFDFSIKCQISGKIPKHPSRTSSCRLMCVVQRNVLEQCQVCSCGRQVQKYINQIIQDWVLKYLLKYIYQIQTQKNQQNTNVTNLVNMQNKKWNGFIRINLDKSQFQLIDNYETQF